MPSHSTVLIGDTFPVVDQQLPAASADSIAWGPHNVLHVCTRWSVHLYLHTLTQAAAQIVLRHHPLCHRTERESSEFILGASWSPSLASEIRYPAETRLCVRTTTNLVVYRVARLGATKVRTSKGIGLACAGESVCPGEGEYVSTEKDSQSIAQASKNKGSCSSPSGGAGVDSNIAASHGALSKNGRGVSKVDSRGRARGAAGGRGGGKGKSPTKGKPKGKKSGDAPLTQKARGRPRRAVPTTFSSEDDDSDDDASSNADDGTFTFDNSDDSSSLDDSFSFSETSSSSGLSSEPRGKGRRTKAASAQPQKANSKKVRKDASESVSRLARDPPHYIVIDTVWCQDDVLAIVSHAGVHLLDFHGDDSDDAEPQTRRLPPPVHNFSADVLATVVPAPPCCISAVVSAFESDGDDGANVQSGVCSSIRRCSSSLLIVASPYALRVLQISSVGPLSGTAVGERPRYTANLLHYVEVPQLRSYPSSICCVEALPSNINAERGTRGRGAASFEVTLQSFISAPSGTLRGRFSVQLDSCSTATAAGTATPSRWFLECLYSPQVSNSELVFRKIMAVSLRDVRSPLFLSSEGSPSPAPNEAVKVETSAATRSTTASTEVHVSRALRTFDQLKRQREDGDEDGQGRVDGDGAARPSCMYLVMGIGSQCVTGLFTEAGNQFITLFRCPSTASMTEMPPDTVAAVSGLAIHPTCTLSVLAVVPGDGRSSPLHLMPLPSNDPDTFMYRMLELSDVFQSSCASLFGGYRGAGRGGVSDEDASLIQTGMPFDAAAAVGSAAATHVCLHELLSRQRSFAFSAWETLFPQNSSAMALRVYTEARRSFFAPPSLSATTNSAASAGGAGAVVLQLRRQYLALRDEFGVDLFLRWMLPATPEALAGRLHIFTSSLPQSGDGGHGNGGRRRDRVLWWELLLSVQRRCPWDLLPVTEFIVANAIAVMARKSGYAGFAPRDGEVFRGESDASATDADTLSYEGALEYLRLYVERIEKTLDKLGSLSNVEGASKKKYTTVSAVQTAEAASAKSWTSWTCSTRWLDSLRNFMRHCTSKSAQNSRVHAFPCSVCDAPLAASMCLSLSYASEHVPPALAETNTGSAETTSSVARVRTMEKHTTVFSGTTFAPLSLFSNRCVMTRCIGCGLCDFAVSPLCRVCGGLLQ